MPANSNAVATVTIQDQDALSTAGVPVLVQRLNASVTFPSANAIQYSGYQLVTSSSFVQLTPGTNNIPFVYIRNANASGGSVLIVEWLVSGAPATTVILAPGGIFLFTNPTSSQVAPFTSIQQVSVAVFAGAPVIMEYLYAF